MDEAGTVACPEGITRATVLELCAEHDIPSRVDDLSLTEAYRADEAFCTGTMGELASVTENRRAGHRRRIAGTADEETQRTLPRPDGARGGHPDRGRAVGSCGASSRFERGSCPVGEAALAVAASGSAARAPLTLACGTYLRSSRYVQVRGCSRARVRSNGKLSLAGGWRPSCVKSRRV